MTADTVESSPLVHSAFFYDSDQSYLDELLPFVTDGLAAGEPVAAIVPGENLALLRRALGSAAEQVHMVDMTEAGRNPGRIIAGVLRSFADEHQDRHVRIIGEPVWPGRTDAEYPACAQHEALINAAFEERDATIVCPYDASGLDAVALKDARATHPLVCDGGRHIGSADYAPGAILDRYNGSLDRTPDVASYAVTSVADLHRARRFATDYAQVMRLSPDLIDDLALIVTELVTNSLLHTDGSGTLRLWQDDGHLVCEVRDNGRLRDPLAGRRPANVGQPNGRGLLLVNDLADLVRQHTGDQGTIIRAYLRPNCE